MAGACSEATAVGTRLKILLVTGNLLLGGLETHVYDLCCGLLTRGHQVSLYAPYIEAELRHRLVQKGVTLTNRPEAAEFDIIHAHPWTWGLLRGLELSILTNKPLVATYHGRYRIVWDELRRHGAQIIAVSAEVQSYLGSGTVIENGIDVNWFKPVGTAPASDPFTISFVGRLGGERWRAVNVLAEVSDALGLQLHVVGDHKNLENQPVVKKKDIVWHGPLADIRPVLRASHVVFTTGRGVREAMASGRPVAVLNSLEYDGVVTEENVGVLRYYNFSGRATRRRPVKDLLATDIERLITDSRYWSYLATWGRQYAEEHFRIETMIDAHEKIYLHQCLGASRSPVIPHP